MKPHQPIPLSMIRTANVNGEFATLRVWMILKGLHKHTIIYNLHYGELSKQTGISHTSLRYHVDIMIHNGWAKITNNHLHLTGIEKLKKHSDETCLPVPVKRDKAAQILQFRNIIVRGNIRNQQKQIARKKETIKNCSRQTTKLSKADMNLIRKSGSIKNLESSFQPVTTLANKTIGKLFTKSNGGSFSKHTGHRIQKQLRQAGLIITKTRLRLFKVNCTSFDALYMNREHGGYIFNLNNKNLYRRLSNEIAIPCNSN